MRHLAIVLAVIAAVAGCGSDEGSRPLEVVATTPVVADLARNVGGERAGVRSLLAPGADPHGYEPRPSDARALTDAGLVLRSGGDVDGWLDDLVESADPDADRVDLIESVHTLRQGDEVDPHWWHDPRNARRAVARIRDAMIEADPAGADGYRARARVYTKRLERLGRESERCLGSIPSGQRKLVTTHDALGYMAARYGLRVVGAVIPSLSTEARPSARQARQLVDQIEAENINAVFPESSLNKRLESAISREAGVRVGGVLYADGLKPGTSYVDTERINVARLARGMSAGRARCRS